MTRSLDQIRAQVAFEMTQEIKGRLAGDFKLFKSYVKSMPALIHNDGLIQTLAFYRTKGEKAYGEIIRICEAWLKHQDCPHRLDIRADGGIVKVLTQVDSRKYRAVTREIQRFIYWVKRLADGMK
jgi:CRISPR type III-B/RAMP module-associated protein Cmr5